MITPFNNTQCRVFAPDQVLKTLDIEKFKGKWYNSYHKKYQNDENKGECSVTWLQPVYKLN
jgi:hypothetical protein